ncbi:MAG TPA: histidinol dehydrogenase [Kofleriaceae bacterium]|nr:histidinol dehydrogenase [Kofleriaceae bacterium]
MLRRLHAGAPEAAALLDRTTRMAGDIDAQVAVILDDVRRRRDAAVTEYTRRFDRREPAPAGGYEIPAARWDALAAEVAAPVRAALALAAERIRAFSARTLDSDPDLDVTLDGVRLELRLRPLARVGLYVPGGTARYPSSVLMTAIPAKVAGVPEVVMVTPGASPETLLAARLAGVDRVFELGGAQAVGALAYGTETVPRVDKIVGPGNAWVASAKRQVYGEVDIDSIAGPSEVLIVADAGADPAWVAADLIAQAEHDREARAILVTTSEALAAAVDQALAAQLADLPRREIAAAALAAHGTAVIAASLDEAIAYANAYAPEHLELQVADARALVPRCTAAGAIFVGAYSSEAAGDYLAGANHVLPTGGAARYASPLGVHDFRKRTSIVEYGPEAAAAHAAPIAALAACEGLDGHGRSALLRGGARAAAAAAAAPAPAPDPRDLGPLAARVPEALRQTAAYHVPLPPRVIAKLDANELPYGLPPELRARLGAAVAELPLERYPDPAARRLRAAVARQLGVDGAQLVFGNGSDELIAMLCAAFAAPPARVLYPVPSFVYYRLGAVARGVEPIEVPLDPDWQLPEAELLGAVAARRPAVVFLALPNNPTGTLWRMGFARELAARHPDVVVVSDEAYAAYSGATNLPHLASHPNLVVMRTLSKLGMAGLRVGYTISSPAIAAVLEKVRAPYNLSALDQAAAELLVDAAAAWCEARARDVVAERGRLAAGLADAGLRVFPSEANLVLVRCPDAPAAAALWRRLADAGISVRAFGPGRLADCLRITVGTPAENDALLAALR